MQKTTMAVINRKIDSDIITLLNTGTQDTGTAATASTHMVVRSQAILGNNDVPFDGNNSNTDVHLPGSTSRPVMRMVPSDPDFPRAYGVKLLAGRLLDRSRGSDAPSAPFTPTYSGQSFNVLLNESGARQFGFTPQSAVGKPVFLHNTQVTVAGVLADFKWSGTAEPVKPTMFYNDPLQNAVISVRLRDDEVAGTLAMIDRTWRRFAPTIAMQRRFLSADFDKQFLNDDRQGAIFGLFVAIAIFIACMGLFGLAAFTAGRRTKEIGVRKVFGARTGDVIFLLLWQFSVPVLVANAIAWPLAWFYLHNWLEGYAYRITLSPFYFLVAGAAALLIAWATIFTHARRVAGANPIHALRYE